MAMVTFRSTLSRRAWLGALAVTLARALRASPAGAGAEWCSDDPLVTITTPAGAQQQVWVSLLGLGAAYLPQLQAAQITWSVQPALGGAATSVAMGILIPSPPPPGTPFAVAVTVSSGAQGTGTIYGGARGASGQCMDIAFTLPVA